MDSGAEQFDVRVTVSWRRQPKVREVLLSELADVIDGRSAWPYSFECESLSVCETLVALSPIAHPDMDVVEINGIEALVATTPNGDFGFVPFSETPGVEIMGFSSASWLPGGPAVFDQSETIYRFDKLYWSEASGDAENQCVVVGQFETEELGIRAAARSSVFFSVDDNGKLSCELDDWPQDE